MASKKNTTMNNNIILKTDSYYTLAAKPKQKIYFSLANTPISNFCASSLNGYISNKIIINNLLVNINDVHTLAFGSSYGDVSSIGDYWLFGDFGGFSSLVSIDFSGLSSLNNVGDCWMSGARGGFKKISSLNFNGLNNLKFVGNGWMIGGFLILSSIDFSGLSSLTTVGDAWMLSDQQGSFIKLASINFNGLCSLNSVGNWWMGGGGDPTKKGSNRSFMNLSSINFSDLSSLSSVGDYWMYGAFNGFPKLSSISFNGLSSLTSAGDSWMFGAENGFPNLSSIDFSALSSLYNVGDEWMAGAMDGFLIPKTKNTSSDSKNKLTIVDKQTAEAILSDNKEWKLGAWGFLNMKIINVGNISYDNIKCSFKDDLFAHGWIKTGIIIGNKASEWKKGWLKDWNILD